MSDAKNMTFIEYFENILYSQPKVDNVNMSQREIVIMVEHGQTVDYIRYELWRLCQKLESKLGLEYDFHSNMFKKLAEKLAKESYGGNKYLQNVYGVTPYGILCEYLLWMLILIWLIAQLLLAILVIST